MRPAAIIPALALVALIWATDLPATLGAHPQWSGKSALIGAPIGLALAWIAAMWIAAVPRLVIFTGVTAFAAAAAFFGKRAFVASFGDSALAGQFWFFGWIGTMAGVAALALTLAALALRR